MERVREFASQRKSARRAIEARERAAQVARDAAFQQALAKSTLEPKGRVDRFLEWHTTPERERDRRHDPLFSGIEASNLTTEFFDVLRIVEDRTPKLMEKEYVQALAWACRIPYVLRQPFVRPPADWKPKGKGRDTLFRSLLEHLLARFPVTPILWTPLFDRNGVYHLLPLIGHVAGGGSLYDYVSGKVPSPGVRPNERPFPEFPIPMTRKMCHDLLAMPSGLSFVHAIRRIQVRAAGGSERLFQALVGSPHFGTMGDKDNEPFMATVIDWLSKLQLINPSEIGPLLDYIVHRRNEDVGFSMKARSAVTLLRAMHAWHDGLTRVRSISSKVFQASGLKALTLSMDRKEHAQDIHEVWRIRELLSARQLHDEGRRMSHCVYSYESSCASGRVSIWSMTMEDGQGETGNWSMLTIEVVLQSRQIVQARGRFNRVASAREHGVMARWAQENGLTINLGKWG